MIGKLNKKDILALSYITLLSLVAVVYGFSVIPSPASEQTIATDHKRVVDLAYIKEAVDNYYQTNTSTLPQTLDEITTRAYDSSTPLEKNDPQTNQLYEYTVTGPYSYRLCATFTTDSSKELADTTDQTTVDYPVYKAQFVHPTGHFCFNEHETPPYYPPYPCRARMMCPMIRAKTQPAVYNGNAVSPSVSGGSAQ